MSSSVDSIFGRNGRRGKRAAAKQGKMVQHHFGSNLTFPSTVLHATRAPVNPTEFAASMCALEDDLQSLYDGISVAASKLDTKVASIHQSILSHADMLAEGEHYLDGAVWIDFSSANDIDETATTLEYSPCGGVRLQSLPTPVSSLKFTITNIKVIASGELVTAKLHRSTSTQLTPSAPLMYTACSTQDGDSTLEILADLGSERTVSSVAITRVMVSPLDIMDVTVSVSADGESFADVAFANMDPSADVTFEPVSARYVRFHLTKHGSDGYDVHKKSFTYKWVINALDISRREFYESGCVVTDTISPHKVFSDIAVALDKHIPDRCDYTISVATGRDGYIGPWVQVRDGEVLPLKTHTHVVTGVSLGIRNVNLAIASLSLSLLPGMQDETLRVFRNVGAKGDNRYVAGGSPKGWQLTPPYYSCVIRCDEDTVIDVGSYALFVDGVSRVGKITISKGVHQITVHESVWSILSPDTTQKQDTMYPYNIRYIIEGHPNIKRYVGFPLFAGGLMKRVTYFQLRNHQSVVNPYSYAVYNDAIWIEYIDNSVKCETDEIARELYRVEYIRDVYPTPNCFAVKINLYSENSSLTPVIKAARIRLGGQT